MTLFSCCCRRMDWNRKSRKRNSAERVVIEFTRFKQFFRASLLTSMAPAWICIASARIVETPFVVGVAQSHCELIYANFNNTHVA